MVRRLLLAVVVTVLAIAMPAAAEGDADPPTSQEDAEPAAADCPPMDIACFASREAPALDPLEGLATNSADCQALDLTASPTGMVDPDRCWQKFIERAIGGSIEVAQWAARATPVPFPF